MGKGKITGTAVLTGLLLAGAAGCGGAQPPGGASETAHRLPKVLSASQLEQQKAVKITECAANASEDLVLAGTVMNVLPRTAGFQLRFDIYDANGVLLEGPGALFTSPGIASIQPGETGQFTDISPLNGSSTVTPVTCVLRGAVVRPPRSARTRSPASPVPAQPPRDAGPRESGHHKPGHRDPRNRSGRDDRFRAWRVWHTHARDFHPGHGRV